MPTKKRIVPLKDPKKESIFKGLACALDRAGFVVRREKLKAGPGWRVVSGSCRAETQKLIFVDPRLPQDDQIIFLRARAASLGVSLAEPEAPAA